MKNKVSNDFYFIDINRTGSTSIRDGLDLGGYDRHYSVSKKRRWASNWDEAFTFSMTRNPYAKVLSQWKHRKVFHDGMDFNDWVYERYWRRNRPYQPATDYFERLWWPQSRWLFDRDGWPYVDFIGHLETIETDWEVIKKRTGKRGELPHRTKAHDRRTPSEMYDRDSVRIVNEVFAADFQILAYDQVYKTESL